MDWKLAWSGGETSIYQGSSIKCRKLFKYTADLVRPWGHFQFSSVAQSCLTLCDPMDCSTLGLPVHLQLPEFTQTHVLWVCDTFQPSHPLLSPSPAFNFSQHQGIFKWVSSSHQVAKVLEFQLQHQSFHWTFRMDWLELLVVQGTLKSLLQSTVRKQQFFSAQFSL